MKYFLIIWNYFVGGLTDLVSYEFVFARFWKWSNPDESQTARDAETDYDQTFQYCCLKSKKLKEKP